MPPRQHHKHHPALAHLARLGAAEVSGDGGRCCREDEERADGLHGWLLEGVCLPRGAVLLDPSVSGRGAR